MHTILHTTQYTCIHSLDTKLSSQMNPVNLIKNIFSYKNVYSMGATKEKMSSDQAGYFINATFTQIVKKGRNKQKKTNEKR